MRPSILEQEHQAPYRLHLRGRGNDWTGRMQSDVIDGLRAYVRHTRKGQEGGKGREEEMRSARRFLLALSSPLCGSCPSSVYTGISMFIRVHKQMHSYFHQYTHTYTYTHTRTHSLSLRSRSSHPYHNVLLEYANQRPHFIS